MISDLSDDFPLTFSLTINCSELIFPFISSSWQLLPTLAIWLINVDYLFRLTYALNLVLSQDWFFWRGFFFSSATARPRVSEFPLNSLILDVDLSWLFGFVGKAEEKLRLAVQAQWDTLKSFCCLSARSSESFKEERWIPFRKVLKAVSALLTHISGLKRGHFSYCHQVAWRRWVYRPGIWSQ